MILSNCGRLATVGLVLCAVNIIGLIAQWLCSTLVLLKIRQVKKKISKNKLNQNSANRFRKQVRPRFVSKTKKNSENSGPTHLSIFLPKYIMHAFDADILH